MRAFIAIELPAPVRAALVKVQTDLAQAGADVRWVEEANLHVTMRFLGGITDAQRHAIEELVREVADRFDPIRLSLSHPGAFPSASSPRVIWVGVGQGQDVLERVASALEEGLSRLGLSPEERGFVAHVTLGRVRSSARRAPLSHRLTTMRWTAPEPFRANHLTLFQSTLTRSGALYTPLATLPFTRPL